ncbi:HIT domain-containing protein [Nanchangia anserum]|uniref:HIT domain-containing protein n=1 Tax=Nanchangia anserum TaxID=2692125 RepID=A0A8I0GBY9_9ACTO|nr:HIT domain-containing protein [Nanchangia anserum]MBD3688743.1 HIT domain-containing protein [Nanchangia anserum]QOX82485.1 HIT domain-containing protein [Nanchangia anserum]
MTCEVPPAEAASAFAGDTDGFERLWTPHRWVYISGEEKPKDATSEECPFCAAPGRGDEEGLIVYRGTHVFVLMNLFPYNAGHVLVCPYRHVSGYIDLDADERAEFGEVTAQAIRVIQGSSGCQGLNLGMNQGQVAGAGIAAHLHQHIVPRWLGDANFFPLIAQVKAVPELIGQARERLARDWDTYAHGE